MGFHFRRSKKIGPVNVTLSSGGLGVSAGIPGARIGRGADGRTHVSAGIPGTGISYQEYSSRPKPSVIAGLFYLLVLGSCGACGADACYHVVSGVMSEDPPHVHQDLPHGPAVSGTE